MEKCIYDEKNGLWYELQGDYYIPCLKLPDKGQKPIGIWGQRHRRYLWQHRKVLYAELLTSGRLNCYLADLNEQAENMFLELVKKMAVSEGVTEQLKAQDQVGKADKQYQGSGNGNRKPRNDLRIRHRAAGRIPCRLYDYRDYRPIF